MNGRCRIAAVLAVLSALVLVGPITAPARAQNNDLAQAAAEMTRLEALADAAWQSGDLVLYRDMLGEVFKLGLRYPALDPLRRARAQQKLANYLHDRESDFVSARLLAQGALEIFRAHLGDAARETLQQRADLIYFRLQQAEMSEILQRSGITPQFGTGDPRIDEIVTDADLAVFEALSAVVDREERDEGVRTAVWANYVSMLVRAGRYDRAYAASAPRLREMNARMNRGEPIPQNVRMLTLLTVVDLAVADQKFEQAWNLYLNGMDDALHYLRSAIWRFGVRNVSDQRETMRLFAEGFVHLAYRIGVVQEPDAAEIMRHHAFEAVQFAGFNPAAASVAQQGLSDAMSDPALRRDLVRWSQLSPLDRGVRQEYHELATRIAATHPGFADAVVPAPVSIGELQGLGGPAILGADEALIVIFNKLLDADGTPGANGLVLAVTRESSAWAELPLGWADLGQHVLSLHHHLDPGGALTASLRAPQSAGSGPPARAVGGAAFDFGAARALYDAFFGDPAIAALIADKPNWTLVPHGEVMGVPFAALAVADPGGGATRPADALRAVRWLGHERALSVVPSVFALKSLRARVPAAPAQWAYLGLGDPAFQGVAHTALRSADALAASGTRRAALIRALPRLPGTRREVETLARLFDAPEQAVLLGQRASEAELARLSDHGVLQQAGIVHFATHGLLAGAFEGLDEPALALTPPGPGGGMGDGLLTASEAARLSLRAEWVILSACDTAGDDRIDGQGLGGLVQGFFAAGAGNLLVSHWRVGDQAAERLITATLRANRTGASKAEALRQAMRALSADTSRDGTGLSNAHPSVWAPFALVGGG